MKLEHAKLDFISGVNFTADDAPVLETASDAITERIKVIDQALDELNENIDHLRSMVFVGLIEDNATDINEKECDRGYCIKKDNFVFYHAGLLLFPLPSKRMPPI